jgi:ATP synthase subunit 6
MRIIVKQLLCLSFYPLVSAFYRVIFDVFVVVVTILIILSLCSFFFCLNGLFSSTQTRNLINGVVFAGGILPENTKSLWVMDPLEQFDIVVLFSLLSNTLAFTNISLIVVFNSFLIICLLLSINTACKTSVFSKVVYKFLDVVISTLKDSVTVKKYSFVLLFFIVFLFIFVSNLIGMVPYSITITSHFILTLFFSLAFFIGNTIIGVCYHQLNYFVIFLPEGVPVPIVPFLILIEYVSHISKIFSLAIRLFANMMSGHILLKILIGFG